MQGLSDRIIIDTNLWISFLLNKKFSRLERILAAGTAKLLFSQSLIEEFIEVAHRPKFKKYFSEADLQELLLQINQYAEFIEVFSLVNICRDAKDNFLLALGKDGKATHLITGDKDLLVLKKYGKTRIVTISAYLLMRK